MKPPETVAVIGLGMIGGSVARALAARGARVLGYDSNPSHLDAAVSEGVVSDRLSPGLDDINDADAVVIAVYGDVAHDILERLEPTVAGVKLITDVGSTKRSIVSAAEKMKLGTSFVGSHPFAGDHRSGWAASRVDLFENQTVFLCSCEKTTPAAFELAEALWSSLGAKPVAIDASDHDELLAWTSHLPHVVSTALALALARAGIVRRQLGRGGRDVTRLAAGSPDVWTAIALENSAAIESAVEGVERELAEFRKDLQSADGESLKQRFLRARDWSGPVEH